MDNRISNMYQQGFMTAQRREVLAWFERNAPLLGELYAGALCMVHDPGFPGRTCFVAHAVREISNRLPDVVAGPKTEGRLDYTNRLDEIAKKWVRAGLSLDGTVTPITELGSEPSNGVEVPLRLFSDIARFVRDHLETREKPIDAAIRLFEGIAPEDQNVRDVLRPIILQWIESAKWFMGMVHIPASEDRNLDIKEFLRHFELFENSLAALLGKFFDTVEVLDEILEEANS